jgi:hypothetical protein
MLKFVTMCFFVILFHNSKSTMEESKGSSTSTGGFLDDADFPRSRIYVSTRKPQESKKYTFQTKEGSFHFFLALNSGANYSQEIISNCKGSLSCFNCSKPIEKQIYFYPTEYTKIGEFLCSPIPHCRPGCCLRSVQDHQNNYDLLSNFYLMYGSNVVCAPPRFLLYVPGGLTHEKYHHTLDDNLVVQEETSIVRSYLAPVYVSCTFLKGHQLVKDVISLIEELSIESKTSVGPSRSRDNSKLNVVELPTKDLFKTKLSETFTIDPSSYRQPVVPSIDNM